MSAWAAAIIFGGTEPQVVERVKDAGFNFFHPLQKKTIVKRGRRVEDVKPMLPGYLLVQAGHLIDKLLRVRGVLNVVRAEDRKPLLVDGHVIEAFRMQHCDEYGFVLRKPEERFAIGQRVRQREGAMDHLVGIFAGNLNNAESATFSLMGRQTVVYFKQGDLVAA